MIDIFKYFKGSLMILAIGLIAGYYYGGLTGLWTVGLLTILEVSLSFDNAVVNAKVLKDMSYFWRQMFLYIGILIAVIGVRLFLPIVIVSVAVALPFSEVLTLAIEAPQTYSEHLKANEQVIFAFGGAFLLMLAMSYFIDGEKEEHWFNLLEDNRIIDRLVTLSAPTIAILLGLGLIVFFNSLPITTAYFSGVALFLIMDSLGSSMSTALAKNGLIGFLYLEILDASFSLDGVISAFAISDNIIIIMIGLAVGAWFVRSLTIYFVEKDTLKEYKYLEPAAMYAIGFLAIMLLLKLQFHIPEVLVGLTSAVLILAGFTHSLVIKRGENGRV